jgi:serine/threonine-protein kinase SRPK3
VKVQIRHEVIGNEFDTYKRLSRRSQHPGHAHVRDALDTFTLTRPGGDHHCLVQKPLWESLHGLEYIMPDGHMEEMYSSPHLDKCLSLWTTYTQNASLCMSHTTALLILEDIKLDNIMLESIDKSILEKFVQAESG